jgi:hypothetical protein
MTSTSASDHKQKCHFSVADFKFVPISPELLPPITELHIHLFGEKDVQSYFHARFQASILSATNYRTLLLVRQNTSKKNSNSNSSSNSNSNAVNSNSNSNNLANNKYLPIRDKSLRTYIIQFKSLMAMLNIQLFSFLIQDLNRYNYQYLYYKHQVLCFGFLVFLFSCSVLWILGFLGTKHIQKTNFYFTVFWKLLETKFVCVFYFFCLFR